ncbi:MAG: hypothetical protein IJK64_00050 [Clostridia bacterium]|nr:hypothetical protein [Clostridia bacterium]
MLKPHIVSTDSFLCFELVDESMERVDSTVITKQYPHTVLHFFPSAQAYLDAASAQLQALLAQHADALEFDAAIEARTEAEFILYREVHGL